MSTTKFHLVIVAGGLGSRLAPLTNHIPKFLVNIGKETGYVEQMRYWADYQPESVTVIVNQEYSALVQEYHKLYFQTEIVIKTVSAANGSADAIFSTCDHLEGKSVKFTWCDVLPGEPISLASVGDAPVTCFLNYDGQNRYDLVNGVVEPAVNGGIFGMYFLREYYRGVAVAGEDFVDTLAGNGDIRPQTVGRIIDFGDKLKLSNTRDTADLARSFNKVEMHAGLVLKSALNETGRTLIERELAWYTELDACKSTVRRPKIWRGRDSFVMERCKGRPIYEVWPHLDEEGRKTVLENLLSEMRKLHSETVRADRNAMCDSIWEECFTKIERRHTEIRGVLSTFNVQRVNGRTVPQNHVQVFTDLAAKIMSHYKDTDTAQLIHGDLQMSNSLVDGKLNVTLIDPRGYFGKIQLYGLADYDYAKVLYSLSGYDLFNYDREFSVKLVDGDLRFKIKKPDITGCDTSAFSDIHPYWVAVCWLGLAQYIKCDPVKMLAAHYHGLMLANDLLAGQQGD